MKQLTKTAVTGIIASSLMAFGFTGTAVAASTTMNGQLPNGKPFQYLNSRIDSLEAKIDALIVSVTSLQDWRVKAQNALLTLQADVANNAGAIALLKGQIADVNDILKTKQDIIKSQCPANQFVYSVTPTGELVCRSDLGSNGLAVLTVENVVDVAALSGSKDVNATCPTGTVPTGGSFNAASALTANSSGITAGGYKVNVTNSTNVKWPVSVTATCLAINP